MTAPYIDRAYFDNPVEIGYPDKTGDSLPYTLDVRSHDVIADKTYNLTEGGKIPYWRFE